MKHPIQPIEEDEDGTRRFKQNEIVKFLLDAGVFDMNSLSLMKFSDDDRSQFAQLIGYSTTGFSQLPYVDTYTLKVMEVMEKNLDEILEV